MVVASSMWLNTFPPTDGIPVKIRPITLVTGIEVNHKTNSVLDLDHTSKHKNKTTMVWGNRKLDPLNYVHQENHK